MQWPTSSGPSLFGGLDCGTGRAGPGDEARLHAVPAASLSARACAPATRPALNRIVPRLRWDNRSGDKKP